MDAIEAELEAFTATFTLPLPFTTAPLKGEAIATVTLVDELVVEV